MTDKYDNMFVSSYQSSRNKVQAFSLQGKNCVDKGKGRACEITSFGLKLSIAKKSNS